MGPVVMTASPLAHSSSGTGFTLQWGPVVVTGIRAMTYSSVQVAYTLQWGPVVVTGIRVSVIEHAMPVLRASMGSGRGDRNQQEVEADYDRRITLQWGPVVVTGISRPGLHHPGAGCGFNGVRSW